MDTFSDNSRCSSFEALNHDPNLSRLAKNMFQKTNDFMNFELSSNLMDYELIDKMNQTASKSVETMKKVTDDIVVANDEINTKFDELEPLMKELQEIEATVNKLEVAAYRLDAFTQRLEEKVNIHLQKSQQT
ncbi:CLUMA_CG007682, isoform A [Clunio marinus]|uniref:CLUMA_CG007682, isoform A n=1 Tax=Clunio marinus TaxID=568069 RepID=A0A1J1I3J2_9DIPT|nr:CLUMA_CG007682, isoform A [Clunio marinus]